METMYQRGKIQEESMYYEHKKHDGSLPLIGVNTFLPKDHGGEIATEIELIRSTEEEKGQQIANVKRYGEARNALASDSLKVLQVTARDRRNVFEQLIEAVKYNSLGQISHALYEVGGGVSAEYVRTDGSSDEARRARASSFLGNQFALGLNARPRKRNQFRIRER